MGSHRLRVPNLSGILKKIPFDFLPAKLSLTFYLCTVAMVGSLLLGGGTRGGFLSDAILQLLAIPLLLVCLWKLFEVPLTRQMRLALWFCLAIAILPLIQLVPLPPWLWTALPNRQPSAETFDILGRAVPWMPISVSPQATWLSALSLVPPLAIFLGTLLLAYRERRLLSLVVIAVGIVSVFVGLIQVAQGEQSPLRFFEITNPTEAVGFFANRNHFAALLYCLMLFAVAWTVQRSTAGARKIPNMIRPRSWRRSVLSQFSSYSWPERSWRVRALALVSPLLPYLALSRLVFQLGALAPGPPTTKNSCSAQSPWP